MLREKLHRLLLWIKHLRFYFQAMFKWLILALVIGALSGFIGSLFHIGVNKAELFRREQPWLLFCLPAAGLAITALYKLCRTEGVGTDAVLEEVQSGKGLRFSLLPAIFFSTILTHLCGGSAGREGAALQMGGAIGYRLGRLFRLDERDLRTSTMIGMAALFTALFGTPLAASVFSIAVISVGVLYHAAFIPCLTASITAYGISLLLGVEPTRFVVAAPALEPLLFLKVAVLGILCALVSALFCGTIHLAEHAAKRLCRSPYLRSAFGGCVLIALTLLVGSQDYNGAGMGIITAAIEQGTARPEAAVLKLVFTAVTLAAGFKGGEVVPSFFVGATFGCVVGPLLGIPASFAAAIGLVSVFCGAVNCPIASIFLSVELFGSGGVLYFALSCGLSYVLSGYSGLYSSQKILYSKLKAQYINAHVNAYHTGDAREEAAAACNRSV